MGLMGLMGFRHRSGNSVGDVRRVDGGSPLKHPFGGQVVAVVAVVEGVAGVEVIDDVGCTDGFVCADGVGGVDGIDGVSSP